MNKCPFEFNSSGHAEDRLEPANGLTFRGEDSTVWSTEEIRASSAVSSEDDDRLSDPCRNRAERKIIANEGWRSKLRKVGSVWSSWRTSEMSDSNSFNWKNKISLLWNNIKYSGTWMHLSDDDYSSEGPKDIVLLGQFYNPEGSAMRSACGASFMDFCRDYYSRIWITYRTGMPPLLGSQTTSDCGWGCMIRTTQMALAHAIVVSRMTREWRFFEHKQPSAKDFRRMLRSDPLADAQVEVLKLFEDCQSAPLGIHRLLEIACADGSVVNPIGRWYAPSEVLSLVKKAVELSVSPLTSDLSLLLALDGQVMVSDAERESRAWSKRLLLFVPLRLGTNRVNPLYHDHVRQIFSLRTCLGILGGKPAHSLYFIGCFGHDVIYLDPHVAQEYMPISKWNEPLSVEGEEEKRELRDKKRKHPLSTYHCHSFSKMSMKEMDPSCVVGFMFKSREEMDESFHILNLHQVVDMDLGPGKGSKRTKDPLFSVHYQEIIICSSHNNVTDDERQQALANGFEML